MGSYLRGLHFFDIQQLSFGHEEDVAGADLVPGEDGEDVLFFEKDEVFV